MAAIDYPSSPPRAGCGCRIDSSLVGVQPGEAIPRPDREALVAAARAELVRCLLLTPDLNEIPDEAQAAIDDLIAAVRAT